MNLQLNLPQLNSFRHAYKMNGVVGLPIEGYYRDGRA